MIPGLGGGMDPRQVNMMMRKLGIQVQDLEGVQEIVIKTATADYIFDDATVSVMKAQGTETYQISGTPRIEEHEVRLAISEDDVSMVVEQTGCSEDEARAALEETGDLAEAILKLSS